MSNVISKIRTLISNNYQIYIYGTGLWGRNVYEELMKYKIRINGWVVTNRDDNKELFGFPIYEFKNLDLDNVVLVLGLNQHNTREVEKYILGNNFDRERIIYSDEVMGINDTRCGYDEIPCIDITTKIGCNVSCKYCPQDLFIKKYYEKDSNREGYLSEKVLKRCIEHLPVNTNFQFAGFVEPFLNPHCYELIKMVCDLGKTVNLYTTLVGLDEKTLYKLIDLPISYVTLHVADEKGYATIPIDDKYYRMLEIAINSKKRDGTPFVDMCNAQTNPDKKVEEICKGKYTITSTLIDRAGNLEGSELVSKQIRNKPIQCGVCGEKINKNELLPDGTLLLCCMDYGMKHVLGNLKKQSYEELMRGDEAVYIKCGMTEKFDLDILCRKCSCASVLDGNL